YGASTVGAAAPGTTRRSATPDAPSRFHHSVGQLTPAPHPGCAGSASNAVNGTAVIADAPSLGACSTTTPSSSPSAITGAPDMPDHCEAPNAMSFGGNGRGATDTTTLNHPRASCDSTGTIPTASTVPRPLSA